MKRLIVTADDFGLTDRVNQAVQQTHRQGVVTTASLMVTTAGFDGAVDIARSDPGLDVGLHLNLTEGQPVSPYSRIPSLANPSGFIYKHPSRLAAALILGRVSSRDLEVEIRAQIEKAVAARIQVTHLDGHKHSYAIPGVLHLLARILPEYGIHAIRSVKESVPRLLALLRRHGWNRQIALQYGFGKTLSMAWTLSGFRRKSRLLTPQQFYGVTQTGFLDLQAFEDILRGCDDGINEVMCHPGFVDDDLRRTPTRLLAQRQRELDLLTSSELREAIRRAGITLVSYKDLLEHYGTRDCDPLLHRYSAI
jgi:hopanoid biosynthesis associated protein HpnK